MRNSNSPKNINFLKLKQPIDLCDYDDIMYKKGVFISQVNKLNYKFDTVSSSLRGKLFQTYCCSWYGCQTWELNTNIVRPIQIEWNKAIRKIIRLPYETHRNLLPLVINGASFSDQHVSRIKKFVSSFLNSKNHRRNGNGILIWSSWSKLY